MALPAAGRVPFAARAGLCVGIPAAVGWMTGDVAGGLLATLGAFTALYGSGRPYRNRAAVLAGVALSIAVAVVVGVATRPLGWSTAPLIVVVAATATFFCNAVGVGPPGAYMIVLAGAAGTGLPADLTPGRVALLVLAGGALSWTVHMLGVLVDPRGPEKAAVATAAGAVARLAEAPDGGDARKARRAAAQALHAAWASLVTFQPPRAGDDPRLARLRALTRDLHRLFSAQIATGDRGGPADPQAAAARAIGAAAQARGPSERMPEGEYLPLGHFDLADALAESLRRGSPALQAALRVGLAAAVTVALSLGLGLSRSYWAIAAAVVVLHQGLGWSGAARRALQRAVGTLAGLGLAAAVLAARPRGLALAATLAALQFVTEMLVVGRYGLAVVFITAGALTLAAGGQGHVDALPLLWARGVDTLAGCGVGLLVHLLTSLRNAGAGLDHQIERAQDAVERVSAHLARDEVAEPGARRARRDLQHRLFALAAASDDFIDRPLGPGRDANDRMAAVEAVEAEGYRILAACWLTERGRRELPASA